jgi:hypothetical protein
MLIKRTLETNNKKRHKETCQETEILIIHEIKIIIRFLNHPKFSARIFIKHFKSVKLIFPQRPFFRCFENSSIIQHRNKDIPLYDCG